MNYISTFSYSFIIYGEIKGKVIPHKGLTQGAPLSPVLFLFCTYVLSCLLKEGEINKRISWLKFGTMGIEVSHLFFVDDSILCMEANKLYKNLKRVLVVIYKQVRKLV